MTPGDGRLNTNQGLPDVPCLTELKARMTENSSIVLLCADLLMTSSVSSVAQQAGRTFRTVGCADDLESCAPEDLVLIDLSTPGLELDAAAAALTDDQKLRAVVYGPHVQTSLFQAAQDAGFLTVIPRGRFAGDIAHWISPLSQ